MNPWRRLVGTQAEPRRLAPGTGFSHAVLAVGWLSLGLSAWSGGRPVQGALSLGLSAASAGLAFSAWRRRRTQRTRQQ